MNTYVYFDVIKFIDVGGSYPALLEIIWANESMEVINFKNHVMKFENHDIRVITMMDRNEGRRYIEPMKYEVVRGWDHAHNISDDYVHPIVYGELSWHSVVSISYYFDDA